jgi:hypothetical protein
MVDLDPALFHHLLELAVADRAGDMPANAPQHYAAGPPIQPNICDKSRSLTFAPAGGWSHHPTTSIQGCDILI